MQKEIEPNRRGQSHSLFRRKLILAVMIGDSFFGIWSIICAGLAVLWYVVETTTGGIWLGTIAALQLIPTAAGAFLAGPVSARMGSRRLMVYSRGMATVALAIQMMLLALDMLPMAALAVLVFITSCAVGPAIAADTARFPEFTRFARIALSKFNAINNSLMFCASVLAYLISGWLVSRFGIVAALIAALAASTICLILLYAFFPKDNKAYRARLRRARNLSLLKDSLRFLTSSAHLTPVLYTTIALTALGVSIKEVIVPYIVENASYNAQALAWVFVISNLSGAIGALTYSRFDKHMNGPAVLRGSLLIFGACGLALAWSPTFAMCIVLAIITGVTYGGILSYANTQVQLHAPANLRAGMIGVAAGMELSLAPPFAFLIGAGMTWFGLVPTLLASSVLIGCAALVLPIIAGRISAKISIGEIPAK